ncbi:MAG TPA: alpha/beta fold hydrolase [Solirubrobacteraceae bacterium]|jgi:pimeloyl-ACP methyl ester carboxylesterase|nr:alpha/beta fold hydrolase [Solirubrobacteraceae bacterium]
MSGQLAIEDSGAGEALVLIHGLATTRQIWGLVAPALAEGRRVVTLDVPGFGESAPAGPGFELAAVAERIARGLAGQGVRAPFDLVGHSLGAGVALTLAAARPRSVRRLVLVAPAGLGRFPRPASYALAAAAEGLLAGRRRVAALADLRWGRRVLLGLAAADGASIAPTHARLMIDASAGAQRTATALATITRANLVPLLRATEAPLGVLWGAEDRTVPARNVALVREARPDVRVLLIERAGHVPMVERPDVFVAALEGLLGALDRDVTTRAAKLPTVG